MADKKSKDKFNIPIRQTDLSILNNEFSSMKEAFIAEIKRMDEEMSQFSADLMHLYSESATLLAEASSTEEESNNQNPRKDQKNWDSLACSPLVEVEGENKTMKLQFDVSQFDPCEVTVKILNETLIISASHEEKTDNSSLLRQYYRELKIPKGVDPGNINSTLSKDGILIVQAPLPQPAITDQSCGGSSKCRNS